MKRVLTCIIIAGLVMAMTGSSAAAQPRPEDACRFQNRQAGTWTTDEVMWTARCLAKRMNVDVAKALYIGNRESGWHRLAVSWTGCCYGVYQHHLDYWSGRVQTHMDKLRKYGVKDLSWSSPRAQAVVTFAMVKSGGWGPWGG